MMDVSRNKEFVDNVEIQEPLGSSDHNQLHFNINIKSDKTKVKQCRRAKARSIINKKTELNIMVDDIKPHIYRNN